MYKGKVTIRQRGHENHNHVLSYTLGILADINTNGIVILEGCSITLSAPAARSHTLRENKPDLIPLQEGKSLANLPFQGSTTWQNGISTAGLQLTHVFTPFKNIVHPHHPYIHRFRHRNGRPTTASNRRMVGFKGPAITIVIDYFRMTLTTSNTPLNVHSSP